MLFFFLLYLLSQFLSLVLQLLPNADYIFQLLSVPTQVDGSNVLVDEQWVESPVCHLYGLDVVWSVGYVHIGSP